MAVIVRADLRVTHTRRFTKLVHLACDNPTGHRNGVLTGRTDLSWSDGVRAEVQWDCGHVRWPLVTLLTELVVPADWTAEYQRLIPRAAADDTHPKAWFAMGLSAHDAATWLTRGFHPNDARPWVAERFGVDAADAAWSEGYLTPAEVRQANEGRHGNRVVCSV